MKILPDNHILNVKINTEGKERIKALLDIEENLIFFLDKNGFIKEVNNFGALSLDYKNEELTGFHITDIVSFKDKARLADAFRGILNEKQFVHFEARFITKNGEDILFDVNAKPVYSAEQGLEEVLVIGRNISKERDSERRVEQLSAMLTEAKRLVEIERERANSKQSMLEELNRLKSEFISNISHEFRTPLASIIGFSETIASDPSMPPEMRDEFNEIILHEGKRLAKLINDVLDITKIEGGKIEVVKSQFDAVKMIKNVIEANSAIIEAKKLEVTAEYPTGELLINADEEKIFLIFNQLINNAVKFTREKGRISVIVKNLYKELEVIVSDTGIGIPEKDLPFIFQKFYRVSRPGMEIPGTGLGLMFVKQIIDMHKGFIKVQSGNNNGTTFLVKLPKS